MAEGTVDQKPLSSPSRPEQSALQGSIDSFPVADVLALLASTGHTGALDVSGNGTSSRVFLDAGAVVAAEAGGPEAPVEVVAEMLRLEEGEFAFEPDELPVAPGPPMPVQDLLVEARARLDEWYAIESVLPSADHVVALAGTAPQPEVVLSAAQWRAVAAVGEGGPVGLVLERVADDELDAMRLLKGLVDAGLLEVVDPRPRPSPRGLRHIGEDAGADAPASAADAPVIVVRAPAHQRVADPALEARLDALAEQFEVLYEVAQAATIEEPEPSEHRSGLLAKLRHRHDP